MDLQTEKLWIQTSRQNQTNGGTTLVLEPVNDTFQPKRLTLVEGSSIKIGRMTNKGTTPTDSNGYFDSKVLSRNHAEVIYRNGQVFIKDLKSSNGTFINGKRLSAEGKESSPVELKHGDDLEFGVDIVNEQDKKLLFRKVAAKVCLSQAGGEIYDSGINGIEHQKAITNGHISIKRRSNRVLPGTENSLLAMLEAELDRARVESRYLSELGSMLNDATNTLDSRSKRMPPSDKVMDLRFYEDSHTKLEEAQNKLRETEAKLNEAICAQKEYKEKFMASDRQVIELKEKYTISEKMVNELEQKCTSSEKKISELEQNCIQLEQKCKESDQKVVCLEDKCKDSELRIKVLEDALQSTVNVQTKTNQFEDLEERLIRLTNELSDNRFFLDDTRDQLKRTEKELHSSQKKCREFQLYATKYNDAMKTIEELRSCEASYGNRIEMRDEAIEKFDEERNILLTRIRCLEETAKKNDTEFRRVELLNKSLKEEIDRLNSSGGLLRRRHRKQESEPIKEFEMTDECSVMAESRNLYEKKSNKKYTKSLFIKGSIGVVVLGIGAWCFSKLYP